MLRSIAALLVLSTAVFVTRAHTGADGARVRSNDGKPVVVQHYDCDGAPQYDLGKAHSVKDGGQMTFRITGKGMVYFTITTDFHDPSNQSRDLKGVTKHFVLGTYESGQGATARVQGRKEKGDADAALIEVDRGWLWVSSTPPPAWAGAAAKGGEPTVEFSDAGEPGRPIVTPAVSWSIYTILRNQFSWAGATATRFIYRVENASSPSAHASVVYSRDPNSEARHTYKDGSSRKHAQYKNAYQHRVGRRSGPKDVKKTADESADAEFVRYAEARVGLLTRQPSRAAPECGRHDDDASR